MSKFKSNEERILEAISNNGTTFSEFCRDYSDTPERGDKKGWGDLFKQFESLDSDGYIIIDRDSDNRIQLLVLSESGVARLKELQSRAF